MNIHDYKRGLASITEEEEGSILGEAVERLDFFLGKIGLCMRKTKRKNT